GQQIINFPGQVVFIAQQQAGAVGTEHGRMLVETPVLVSGGGVDDTDRRFARQRHDQQHAARRKYRRVPDTSIFPTGQRLATRAAVERDRAVIGQADVGAAVGAEDDLLLWPQIEQFVVVKRVDGGS